MDVGTGEIKRLESVTPEEMATEFVELKDEEVEPLIALPEAERPAALAKMRGIPDWLPEAELEARVARLKGVDLKPRKDKTKRRAREKTAKASRRRNRR